MTKAFVEFWSSTAKKQGMNSGNVRNSCMDAFRSEGRVTSCFVLRESGVLGMSSSLVASPTEDVCPMVNLRLIFYPPQINTSQNTIIYLSVKALVTLSSLYDMKFI